MKSHPHPKGKGNGGRSPKDGEQRPCYFYLVKRDCRNGKDCPFSHDTKLLDKAEKNAPPTSRSALPKGRGDKVCHDYQKGKCNRGEKCPCAHKNEKRAALAIKMAVTFASLPKIKKGVTISDVIHPH